MQVQITRPIVLAFALFALSGCRSGSFVHYVSPRVTGRVRAADTLKPLANTSVQRGGANRDFEAFGPPKGGQLLMQSGGARTDAEGRFVLHSKSVIAIFHQPGWTSVALTFSHSGYRSLQTNYTSFVVTNKTSAGAPAVDIGDVLLRPVAP